jgi:predicted dinucleotide-binding enzyme
MKVGVLGSGTVGQALASGFLKHGHQAMLASRDGGKLEGWAAQNPGGLTGSFNAAGEFGEVIVLAVKGTAAPSALTLAGAVNLAGKVVIDATNPIADAPPEDGVLKFFTGPNESLMEQLQQEFADARLVKAFNSVGLALFVNPVYAEGRPTMFICGNDTAAKQTVTEVLDQFGWDSSDMGTATAARAIEPLCLLWCIRGFRNNEWTHAFKLLHQPGFTG